MTENPAEFNTKPAPAMSSEDIAFCQTLAVKGAPWRTAPPAHETQIGDYLRYEAISTTYAVVLVQFGVPLDLRIVDPLVKGLALCLLRALICAADDPWATRLFLTVAGDDRFPVFGDERLPYIPALMKPVVDAQRRVEHLIANIAEAADTDEHELHVCDLAGCLRNVALASGLPHSWDGFDRLLDQQIALVLDALIPGTRDDEAGRAVEWKVEARLQAVMNGEMQRRATGRQAEL